MITEITFTYPTPTINIGGSIELRTADIVFGIDIDSNSLYYKRVLIKGIKNNNWTLEDLAFISDIHKKIEDLNNRSLNNVIFLKEK